MQNEVETTKCPGCGRETNPIWLKDDPITSYRRCVGCRTIYASPRLAQSERMDLLRKFFQYSEETRSLDSNRIPVLRYEANLLKSYKHSGRLLDIGCGNGALFQFFEPERWFLHGIELSPSAAAYSSQAYGAKVHDGNLIQAGYPDQFFDLVSLMGTIYYLDQPDQELNEIHRIMAKDGILCIEIPGLNYFILRSRGILCYLIDKKWTRFSSRSTYLNWFSPLGLELLLNRCDFHIAGWWVASSPARDGFGGFLVNVHANVMQKICELYPSFLTWSPNILCLAKPN